LLAYDGSQRASAALHAAAEVASGLGLAISVVHVERAGSDAEAVLAEARQYLESYGVTVQTRRLTGPPHQRIVDVVRDGQYDLLFVGAYGHSRIIEMVLGSTTEFVLRNTLCPVFLAR
jgi:nucleotide-binding universal stress UspA family protein